MLSAEERESLKNYMKTFILFNADKFSTVENYEDNRVNFLHELKSILDELDENISWLISKGDKDD